MKNTILLIALIISIGCYGQWQKIPIDTSATTGRTSGGLTVASDGFFIKNSSYYKTGKTDTIKCVLLITDCENCQSKSVSAYVVREQFSYYGWQTNHADYSDTWSPISHLDINKKPFSSSVIVWQCKY